MEVLASRTSPSSPSAMAELSLLMCNWLAVAWSYVVVVVVTIVVVDVVIGVVVVVLVLVLVVLVEVDVIASGVVSEYLCAATGISINTQPGQAREQQTGSDPQGLQESNVNVP